jgi:hypothetical protein
MRTLLATAIGALLVSSTALSAQEVSDSAGVHRRNDCRLALQIVETGDPAPHREWAYSLLPHCGESAGPAVVAGLWRGTRRLPQDELLLLVRATHAMRDRRIYAALRTFVQDAAADTDSRLHAMALLLRYVDPAGRRFEPSDLRMPAAGPPPPMTFLTHDEPVSGAEPAGDVREDLRALYTGLRDSDPDTVIRNAATILLRDVP